MDPRRCSLCRATSKHLKTGPNPIYFPAWMQAVISQIPCCYLDRQDPVPWLSPTARQQRGRDMGFVLPPRSNTCSAC